MCFHMAYSGDVTYQRRGLPHIVLNVGYATAIAGDALFEWESHPLLEKKTPSVTLATPLATLPPANTIKRYQPLLCAI
jgi:hypothetical protein